MDLVNFLFDFFTYSIHPYAILCEPATAIVAGVTAVAGLVQAVGSIKQGEAAEAAGEFNAIASERNARLVREKGALDEQQFRMSSARDMGDIRSSYAASGVQAEGSVLDVLEESAKNAELDAQKIRYGSEMSAQGYEQEATLSRMRGRSGRDSGYFGAAGGLLKTGAEFGSYLNSSSSSSDTKLKFKG